MKRDKRYSINREGTGACAPQWVVRFCGERLGDASTKPLAEKLAARHRSTLPGSPYTFAVRRYGSTFADVAYRAEIFERGEQWEPSAFLDMPYRGGVHFYGSDWRAVRRQAIQWARLRVRELTETAELRR